MSPGLLARQSGHRTGPACHLGRIEASTATVGQQGSADEEPVRFNDARSVRACSLATAATLWQLARCP